MINIFIAEDDRDDFLMLEEAIGNILPETNITRSRNGKELLQTIDEQPTPDLIFLDLNMPKMSGIDCLIDIRQKKNIKSVPIVIYSTSSDFEDIEQCYKNGCSLYLVKPASFKDLTAQVKKIFLHDQLANALSKSEQQFRLFIQASSEQVYKMSADWKKMYVLTGKEFLTASETLENSWLQQNIPAEDQLDLLAAIHKAIDTKSILELEHRIVKAEGSIGWVFSRAIPVFDERGEIVEWFGTASDITDRKNAEQELKEEHYFLEKITDNTPHLIYVFDGDQERFIYVNKRIEELTGITQEYVYGMGPHLFQKVIHPEDLSTRIDYFNRLSTLKQGETRENEFRLKVGADYWWFRSKDRIFKMEDGRAKQFIGLAEDVTYEKRLQETLINETGGVGLN
jgi:PAS domain S-box-containing protein